MLDYNFLFMLFIFIVQGFNLPSVLDYVPEVGEGIGESCVVHIAHLLGLKVYAGNFESGQGREMACHFSQRGHFLGLGSVQWGKGRLSVG
jgi:hypothetical protein